MKPLPKKIFIIPLVLGVIYFGIKLFFKRFLTKTISISQSNYVLTFYKANYFKIGNLFLFMSYIMVSKKTNKYNITIKAKKENIRYPYANLEYNKSGECIIHVEKIEHLEKILEHLNKLHKIKPMVMPIINSKKINLKIL